MAKRRAMQVLIGALGLAALVTGLLQGDYADTMGKAVRLCLECVGIG